MTWTGEGSNPDDPPEPVSPGWCKIKTVLLVLISIGLIALAVWITTVEPNAGWHDLVFMVAGGLGIALLLYGASGKYYKDCTAPEVSIESVITY